MVFHRQGDSSMCAPSLGWTERASHLPAFFAFRLRSHGVLCEEQVSYGRHHGEIPNSCPYQQGALHQWNSCTLRQWCYPSSLCCKCTKKNICRSMTQQLQRSQSLSGGWSLFEITVFFSQYAHDWGSWKSKPHCSFFGKTHSHILLIGDDKQGLIQMLLSATSWYITCTFYDGWPGKYFSDLGAKLARTLAMVLN